MSDDREHIEDPLTGELLQGTVEEETASYLNMEAKAEESTQNLWMIPFADLMSTLVILFLALFGYAYLGAHSQYEQAVLELQKELSKDKNLTEKEKEMELAKALEKYIHSQKMQDVAHIDMSAQRIKLSLATPVLFDQGKADLKEAARPALDGLAALLSDMPNQVIVEGYTDNVPVRGPRYRSNFELSAARAFSVIDVFLKKGLEAGRFSAYGYGENRPVADNASEAGRQRNRRIEIIVVREEAA